MPDDLYDRDILEWSTRQVELLRHAAVQEQHSDIDWAHIIDEIATAGTAQLNDFRGSLRQAMDHLVQLHLHRDDGLLTLPSHTLGLTLDEVAEHFTPSMRARVDLNATWKRVLSRIQRRYGDNPRWGALPDHCPWTLDALLAGDRDTLFAALAGWPADPVSS